MDVQNKAFDRVTVTHSGDPIIAAHIDDDVWLYTDQIWV